MEGDSVSKIEWTDATWNVSTGCDRVSLGCDNCYALTMAARLKAMGQPKYQTDGDPRTSGPGFGLAMHADVLDAPLRWRKPRKVFVNSMSDLFHPRVTDEFIARVFAVMAVTPRHTFQVLTKRPKRMRVLLDEPGWLHWIDRHIDLLLHSRPLEDGDYWRRPLPNVWLGTSVEDQQRADERIPALLDTPAAVRFLSCEPLLGPVTISRWLADPDSTDDGWTYRCQAHGMPECTQEPSCSGVQWVIVGGESGTGARPMAIEWSRDIVDQCQAADVPVFVKQLGSRPTFDSRPVNLSSPKGGEPGEWPWFLRRREFPQEVPA